MKKEISLLLTLVLCLTLCACVSSKSAGGHSASGVSGNQSVDYEKILLNNGVLWGFVNTYFGEGFFENGTTTNSNSTWELNGNTVKITQQNGSAVTYEIKELNGAYYLVGQRNSMYSDIQVRYDEIPCKSVEITLDNWDKYFELHHESAELFDQFGEPTGEIRERYYFRLKDAYSRIHLLQKSEVLLRFSQNGSSHDWMFPQSAEYISIDDFAKYPLEMIKIQGTLYFIDGL